MAMKLEAGEVGRSDVFAIFPEFVVRDDSANGRAIGHSPEEIASLAESIKQHGQQQPVVVRRIDGNRVQLVSGYGRHKALLHINAEQPDNPMKLQCVVRDCNPEEAFVRNLVENIDRAATTPVDDAHNQRRLREQYGWSEERIAEFYKKSVSYLSLLRKLTTLEAPIQQEVANGNLAVKAAVALTEVPEAERPAVLEAAKDANGKASTEKITKNVRDRAHAKAEANGEAPKGVKARSMKEVRDYLESMTGPAERDSIRSLCEGFLEFIKGELTERQMSNRLEKWCVAPAEQPKENVA